MGIYNILYDHNNNNILYYYTNAYVITHVYLGAYTRNTIIDRRWRWRRGDTVIIYLYCNKAYTYRCMNYICTSHIIIIMYVIIRTYLPAQNAHHVSRIRVTKFLFFLLFSSPRFSRSLFLFSEYFIYRNTLLLLSCGIHVHNNII